MGVHEKKPVARCFSHVVKRNDERVLRIPAAIVVCLILVAAGLSGCALVDGVGDSDLDDALELVPGEATFVTITHRQASAERLGVDDIGTGADQTDLDRYIDAAVDSDFLASTRFATYLVPMSEEAAFSELDVVWEAVATSDERTFGRIYKMSDDLDLDAVGDDLVDAGYQEDEISGHRHLFLEDLSTDTEFDGMIGPYPGADMAGVVLVPDEHLMFVSNVADELELSVDVLEDDQDSATDAGTFEDVLDDADEPEYAQLTEGPDCGGSPETGSPEAAGFFISGEDPGITTVLAFADGEVDTTDYEIEEREAALAEVNCDAG